MDTGAAGQHFLNFACGRLVPVCLMGDRAAKIENAPKIENAGLCLVSTVANQGTGQHFRFSLHFRFLLLCPPSSTREPADHHRNSKMLACCSCVHFVLNLFSGKPSTRGAAGHHPNLKMLACWSPCVCFAFVFKSKADTERPAGHQRH